LNVVVIGVFIGSVTYVAINYKKYLNESDTNRAETSNLLLFMMILWSFCLAYFFGFFGISFVDKEALEESPSSFGLNDLDQQLSTLSRARQAEQQQQRQTNEQTKPKSKVDKLAPRNDTAICAEGGNPSAACAVSKTTEGDADYTELSNEEVLEHLLDGRLKDYQLEKKLANYERAVVVRRSLYEHLLEKKLDTIPYLGYDYGKVFGANCEIVVGYIPIPVGIVGPLVINGEPIYVPMATTEGCLVASINRGCKAITSSGGCCSVVLKDAITRAPCVRMPSAMRAAAVKRWVSLPDNYRQLEEAFNSTTSYGRLESVDATVAGRNVYLRFSCMSGDAMGMNMVSKGCLKAISVMEKEFPDMVLIAISGNMCTDKKPAAINWILGRGKSIVVEAVIPESVVKTVLKSSVHEMIETNKQKNHIGSAMAGTIGGYNAHAANIVTAVYLATGQDPAQNVESSNCITIMELGEDGKSLHVSVTMPSVEVGTVGGGTHLPAQAGCLEICGVRGAAKGPDSQPGDNSRKLAQIVGASVLAGELSLIAALAANHLVNAHMQHNRKPQASATASIETVTTGVNQTVRRNASMPELTSTAAH
jgi:hydroxymethylglutaryl-CoA reductase (NADPH)